MDFNLQRHCRVAGVVVIFVGLYLHNWPVIILGDLAVVFGFMWTISKVERYIEVKEKANENPS